jgi:carboxyl-terminal processing protease
MPDRYAYLKMGERDLENAMPWDKIDAADYTVWTKQPISIKAIANSKARTK